MDTLKNLSLFSTWKKQINFVYFSLYHFTSPWSHFFSEVPQVPELECSAPANSFLPAPKHQSFFPGILSNPTPQLGKAQNTH